MTNTLTNKSEMPATEIVEVLAKEHLGIPALDKNSMARFAPVVFVNGSPVFVLDMEQRSKDIYQLLDSVVADPKVDYYALVTAGWAAPTDGNGAAPSAHPLRRRVELLCLVCRSGERASALAIGDEDLLIDNGQASGALADAMDQIFK